ncbi:hypothetical protein ACN47E_000833 [Coniothyrium glycines]
MATGIEAAGLVLGSIPLILAGLDFYAKGIAVTKRYWRYKEEINGTLYELRAENTLYINSINMLLIGVVNPKEMTEFLTEPGGARWQDKMFDQKLRARLGTSYDTYMDSIRQLALATEKFKAQLKLDGNGKAQFSEPTAFKEHYKRLKFSLKKADYKDLLEKIRRANQSLYRLTTQTAYLDSQQAQLKASRQPVLNFRSVKARADGFHEALRTGWTCPCSTHHSVNLRLEARMVDVTSEDEDEETGSMRDPFHVLFHYHHHHTPQNDSQLLSKLWTWEEADVRVEYEDTQIENTPGINRQGRAVRFPKNTVPTAVKAALAPEPETQPIKDLCSAICMLQKPERDVCYKLLANEIAKQKYGVLIYPTKTLPSDTASWSVATLRSLLGDPNFARRDRLKLAVTLASSVLQLYETPWLEDNWGKDSVFFVKRPGHIMYDQPFVSQPSAHSFPTSPALPSSMSRIIRNQSLYALGVALIELWHGTTLLELHQEVDGPCNTGLPQIDLMTEWNTADRLVDQLYNDAGAKYGDAVRRCIRCDFDRRASSLGDVQFQKDVYQGVVAQLKENYEFMFQQQA